jgi:hypothetical protein
VEAKRQLEEEQRKEAEAARLREERENQLIAEKESMYATRDEIQKQQYVLRTPIRLGSQRLPGFHGDMAIGYRTVGVLVRKRFPPCSKLSVEPHQ